MVEARQAWATCIVITYPYWDQIWINFYPSMDK